MTTTYKRTLRSRIAGQRGAELIEYSILSGFIAIALIWSIEGLSGAIGDKYDCISQALDSEVDSCDINPPAASGCTIGSGLPMSLCGVRG